MPLPEPKPALVIRYAYLWHKEAQDGQVEGLKDRPCAIILSSKEKNGSELVTVLPVTHTAPDNRGDAIAIPADTASRLGLDHEQSWVVISEYNQFVWPGPDIRPVPFGDQQKWEYGYIPAKLYDKIKNAMIQRLKDKNIIGVRR